MKRDDKITKCIHDIFVEAYRTATPSADFDELVDYAKMNNVRNERGELTIPFDDYEIEIEKLTEITDRHIKLNKITQKWVKDGIRFHIFLGPSPRTKQYNV